MIDTFLRNVARILNNRFELIQIGNMRNCEQFILFYYFD